MSYRDKLHKLGPRKLLACDGGGVRGIISIEILAKIENDLRASNQRPELVLADYFDYVAGTSTGAIIATLVALGYRVDKIRDFYIKAAPEMFRKARLWERFRTKFKDDRLSDMLRDVIGERTNFGSEKLQTLLMMVLRNATTDSPWPITNNPTAKYNDLTRPDSNLALPLWQLVRASTAGPSYFPPEVVVLGPQSHEFIFGDGGATLYNNPAFQLFVMATTDPYQLRWQTGEDKMLIVSIGTGGSNSTAGNLSPEEVNLIYGASSIPAALIAAAVEQQDLLCRIFGECLSGDPINREVGDMIGKGISDADKLFTYVRYDSELSREGLNSLGLGKIDPTHVQQMDSVDFIGEIQEVGRAVAEHKVKAEHFDHFPI